jgi:LL-diaminopimelate aminotransferase
MAGWRVGFVAGSAQVVDALKTLKSNIDSGVFAVILKAAVRALDGGWEGVDEALGRYERRRHLLLRSLDACDIEYHRSPATLYVWARVPGGGSSMRFARTLLENAGVLVAPGIGFGDHGEGWFRLSVTCPDELIEAGAKKLAGVCRSWKT